MATAPMSGDAFGPAVDLDAALETLIAVVGGSGADEFDAFLTGRNGQYTRFAGDRIHQPQDIVEVQVMVRAVVNGHAARASTSSLAGAAQAAASAASLARAIAAGSSAPGGHRVATRQSFGTGPVGPPRSILWFDDTAAFDEASRVEQVRAAMDAAEESGATVAGMFGRAATSLVAATSGGVERATLATEALASCTFTVDDGTSHFVDVGRSSSRLQLGLAIESGLQQAAASTGRSDLEPGAYTVVLGPEATAELLEFLPSFGFSGELAAAGVGLWARSRGQQVAAAAVDIADDALADIGLPVGFDIESVPKQRVQLLDHGVVDSPVLDLHTARVLAYSLSRSRSTGHAHIAREEAPETRAANIVMAAGTSTEAELVAGVDQGVYIQRFWYTRPVDTTATTITGVTRDACFEIRGGRLGRPLRGMRFTQSVLEVLASVDGVGDLRRSSPVMNVWNGAITAPAIRAHGFRLGAAPTTP